jgi:hypothetical protein
MAQGVGNLTGIPYVDTDKIGTHVKICKRLFKEQLNDREEVSLSVG